MYNLLFIKKVLQKLKQYSIRKLAEKYDLSPQTIQKWEKGILPTSKRNKPNVKLDLDLLMEDVKQYPDAYQYERAKKLGVSETCIFHSLKKLGITYKKTLKPPRANEEKRYLFQRKIREHKRRGLDICYLDESGYATNTRLPRKSKRCFGLHDWGAKGRINVIGALVGKLLFTVGLFNCSIDSVVFGTWVQEFLLPNLSKPTVIVMDNATVHKNEMTLTLIRGQGHFIEFLPPYSPDLNDIEHK